VAGLINVVDIVSLLAKEILLAHGYEGHDVTLRPRYDIPLLICDDSDRRFPYSARVNNRPSCGPTG
jgi:hypothetical protein